MCDMSNVKHNNGSDVFHINQNLENKSLSPNICIILDYTSPFLTK